MRNKRKTLAEEVPELAKQWHPTKNGDLKPTDVTLYSNKKVWWLYSYDDPETGKHFDFEWPSNVRVRTRRKSCPFLSGRAVWPGYNDLASKLPELAKQWHPTKNGNLTPADVTCGSNKKVWWYLPYDDPETGKHFDFEWEEIVKCRVNGAECPFTNGKTIWPGFNDLASKLPQLVKQWHPTKNGNLTPADVTCGSNKEVWWYLPYDDPETGKHFDFEWLASIADRKKGAGCPYLCGHAVWRGYNDLATRMPELAQQWHPTQNGDLKPTDIVAHCRKKVFWYLPYDDPETGKHFDFEWEERICNRANGSGCPYLSGHKVWFGYNDLATRMPELAQQWHPTKNGNLTPADVTCGTDKKVWWYLPYDDAETGKHFDFEWEGRISARVNGVGCPYLTGQAVWLGYNDLASSYPEVAKEWHPTKNRRRTPEQVYKKDTRKYWWLCGKCRHSWRASVRERTFEERMCPVCSKNKDIVG